ncbi:MAG: zinc ribbon domain-containing protein [Methanosphaera sp.]|nr:zinc ribbon domain-containing protein [Methanosphaera sp.]
MICPNCGLENVEGAKFCRSCGHPLNNYQNNGFNNYTQPIPTQKNKNNTTILILCITIIILTAIIAGTYLFLLNNNEATPNNQANEINIPQLNVSSASFYLDGNPNTGIPATITVGKEHAGENMEVITTYSRDGTNLNSPSGYENHVVDEDGNIKITEYAPIPKYPDYCKIEIRYKNNVYQYGCDMGKHKGSQTSTPRPIS